MQRWRNSAVDTATLLRDVELTSYHIAAPYFRFPIMNCQILATKIQIILETNS